MQILDSAGERVIAVAEQAVLQDCGGTRVGQLSNPLETATRDSLWHQSA